MGNFEFYLERAIAERTIIEERGLKDFAILNPVNTKGLGIIEKIKKIFSSVPEKGSKEAGLLIKLGGYLKKHNISSADIALFKKYLDKVHEKQNTDGAGGSLDSNFKLALDSILSDNDLIEKIESISGQ